MTLPPDAWPRLKDVFAGARAVGGRAPLVPRSGLLRRQNAALRQEVESLLSSDERAEEAFSRRQRGAGRRHQGDKEPEGQRIGTYQIASRIGAAEWVSLSRRRAPQANRQVAIKVLLPAVADDPDRLERFSREAQVVSASLNHRTLRRSTSSKTPTAYDVGQGTGGGHARR